MGLTAIAVAVATRLRPAWQAGPTVWISPTVAFVLAVVWCAVILGFSPDRDLGNYAGCGLA